MSRYIEYHIELRDHFKVHQFAKSLIVDYATALGHISCLWLWAAGHYEDGNLKKITTEELSYAGRWDGDPKMFESALIESGFMEKGRVLHKWKKYGIRLLVSAKERKSKSRKNITKEEVTPMSRDSHVTTVSKKVGKKEGIVKGRTEGFNQFWEAYPKKVGRGLAVKLWDKLRPSDDTLKTILAAIEQQKQSEQWKKDGGQFIPHPSTWLGQERWTDQPVTVCKKCNGKGVFTARGESGEYEMRCGCR